MSRHDRVTTDNDTDKIVQFTATERNALKWADDECWDLNTELHITRKAGARINRWHSALQILRSMQ